VIKRRILLVLFSLAVLSAAGWFLMRDVQLSSLQLVSLPVLLILVLLTLLHTAIYVSAVTVLLSGLGVESTLREVYLVVTGAGTASFVSNVKLGVPVRILLYQRMMQIPLSVATASMTLETGLWVAMMGTVMLVPVGTEGLTGGWQYALLVLSVIVVLWILLLRLSGFQVLFSGIPGKLGALLDKLLQFLVELKASIVSVKKAYVLLVVALLFLTYLVDASSLALILRNLGEDGVSLVFLVRARVMSYLVGLVSLVPLGLGARDASLALLLTQAGVPKETALSCALLQRTIRLIIPLGLGLVSANIIGLRSLVSSADESPIAS
jgi:uncharacterized protein (TIRG00374 family)